MNITFIGLGLIGASMAMAAKGFKSAVISGVDNDPEVVEKAKNLGVFDTVTSNAAEALADADLVIICIYPDGIAPFIRENIANFKHGALITDVCGVKEKLSREVAALLATASNVIIGGTVDYVGIHPMAGKEVEGIGNAEAGLFADTGFIITPVETSKPRSVELLREFATHIGATKIAVTTPRRHDEIIAYTSDLMHISAAALCLDFEADMTLAYAAGAFRDSTRVAQINPELWSELFLANKEHTLNEIDRLTRSIGRIRSSIEREDKAELFALLETVRKNKIDMQGRK